MTDRKSPDAGWEAYKQQASTKGSIDPFVHSSGSCLEPTVDPGGMSETWQQTEKAKIDAKRLETATSAPPPIEAVRGIRLEFAMDSDTETTKIDYLVDPFLPSNCVVGLFGRGGTAKSSFAATLAA